MATFEISTIEIHHFWKLFTEWLKDTMEGIKDKELTKEEIIEALEDVLSKSEQEIILCEAKKVLGIH